MHLSCICASKFAPEGRIDVPTGAFPPNKSAGLSARSCVTSPGPRGNSLDSFLPQQGIVSILREGGTRARPWVSRRGATFQHAYFSHKYPYLPDLVFNDSLFQVQHRLDYLQCFSQASGASRSQFRLSSFLERCLER